MDPRVGIFLSSLNNNDIFSYIPISLLAMYCIIFVGDVTELTFTMTHTTVTGWPRTLENRENGQKKFPAGKNQGV